MISARTGEHRRTRAGLFVPLLFVARLIGFTAVELVRPARTVSYRTIVLNDLTALAVYQLVVIAVAYGRVRPPFLGAALHAAAERLTSDLDGCRLAASRRRKRRTRQKTRHQPRSAAAKGQTLPRAGSVSRSRAIRRPGRRRHERARQRCLATGPAPRETIRAAWQQAEARGSYEYQSDIEQTITPRLTTGPRKNPFHHFGRRGALDTSRVPDRAPRRRGVEERGVLGGVQCPGRHGVCGRWRLSYAYHRHFRSCAGCGAARARQLRRRHHSGVGADVLAQVAALLALIENGVAKLAMAMGAMDSREATVARNIDARSWGVEFDSQYYFADNWRAELSLASVRGANAAAVASRITTAMTIGKGDAFPLCRATK